MPPKLSVIDLFSGAGGLSLGAARAGFKLRLAVEKDPRAFAAHSLNFPNTRHSAADISFLTGGELLKLAELRPEELCGLIGGPPCQGFSTIGRREVGDRRNQLFKKFFELVEETRPAFYLAENVPGIMDDCYEHIREEAVSTLSGYVSLQPFRVCAADYGAPTTRTRVLFFGFRPDVFPKIEMGDLRPAPSTKKVFVADALRGLPITIKPTWNTDECGWRKVRHDRDDAFGLRTRDLVPKGVGDEATLRLWREKRFTSGCIATNHDHATVKRFAALLPGETDKVSRGIRLDPRGL